MKFKMNMLSAACLAGLSVSAIAQDDINLSAVINGYVQDGDPLMGHQSDGVHLGHSEVAISSTITSHLYGKATVALVEEDGKFVTETEEAFLQTTSLPYGFGLRAGRMLSEIGYLNPKHTHTDAFPERPAAHQAMLGGHYADDGLRIDWVAPTDMYTRIGFEALDGKPLAAEEGTSTIGATNLFIKSGFDINVESSVAMGLSWVHNRNAFAHDEHEEHDEHDEHDHLDAHDEDHHDEHEEHGHDEHAGHSHSASFRSEDLFVADITYKWAPDGNYKYQSLTLTGEYLYGKNADEKTNSNNSGWYVSSTYQFTPHWSASARYGEFKGFLEAVAIEEDHHDDHDDHDHFDDHDDHHDDHDEHEEVHYVAEFEKIKHTDLAVTYHFSHFTMLSLFASKQKDVGHNETSDTFGLRFEMALGDHGAHAF